MVSLAGTEIEVVEAAVRQPGSGTAPATAGVTVAPPVGGQPPRPVRPVLDDLTAKETDAAVIRYRPGTAGEAAVAGVAAGVRRARRRLAGLGSEPWGLRPQVCLVDPFPDPERPGEVVRREAEMAVYMIGSLVFTMVFPFAFRRLLDTALPSGEFSQVLSILTFLAVAFLISLLAGLRRTYLSAYVSASVVRAIRARMFGRLQSLSSSWYGGHQQGDVVSRLFSDVAVLEAGLSQTLREGLFQLLSLVVSATVLFTLNPLLAIIVVAGAPLIALVYKGMGAGAERRSEAVQERVGSLYALAAENCSAQPVVKAFGLETREQGRFGRASGRLFQAYVRLQLYGGLFGLSVNTIVTVLRLVVLGLGSWLILEGSLTVGGLVAFLSVMGEVLSPVTGLTDIGQQIQASTGALARINDVLDAVPEVGDPPASAPLAPLEREIRLAGVGFSYTPERRTLDGLVRSSPPVPGSPSWGPRWAGKSSVLQLLMRFYDPDEGSILFDGRDVRTATVASLRSQLGVVFQDTFLFDTSIRENIALGKPGATDAEVEAAAKAAELDSFVTTLLRGYDTPVGEGGGRLSGGQRQRLAIARALVRDPRVLVLDEATSALHPRTERLIADTLARVGKGRTTVAVTHRLASITGYDRIFVIVAGRLVEQGSHVELLRLGGTYAELWAEQAGGVAPAEAPFYAVAALARVPLFVGLGPEDLATVAARLRALDLTVGDTVPEGGGQLLFVRRGRPEVLAPGIGGRLGVVAELDPGDAFGVAAVVGNESGLVLRAQGPVSLLVLDDEALAGVAAAHPSVAAALERRVTVSLAAPAGGRRLSRLTMAPGRQPGGPAALLQGPSADDVRRASGSYGAVGAARR